MVRGTVPAGALLASVLVLGACSGPGTGSPTTPPATEAGSTSASSAAEVPSTSPAGPSASPGDRTEPAPGSGAVAELRVDGRTFTFELTVCAVGPDGETVVGGPGAEAGTGVASYLDGDAVPLDGDLYGEFRVDVGAEGPFSSTDDVVALGSPLGGSISLDDDGDGHLVTASAWDADGADLGEGTLRFTC